MMYMFKNASSSAQSAENDFYTITDFIQDNIDDLNVGESKNYIQLSFRLKSHMSVLELSKELIALTSKNLFPDQIILNQMIKQLFGLRKIKLAFKLYDLARKKGIMDAHIYHSLIMGIARSDKPNLSKIYSLYECAKQNAQVNSYIISSIFDAFHSSQDVEIEQLMSLFEDARNLNLDNSYVYTKFLGGLNRLNFLPEHHFCEKVYLEMLEKNSINLHTLKAFLTLYSRMKALTLNTEFIFEVYQQNKDIILSNEILFLMVWKSLTSASQKNLSNLYVVFADYSNRFTTYPSFCLELMDLFNTHGAASPEQILEVYQKADFLNLINEEISSKLMNAFVLTPMGHHEFVYQFYAMVLASGKVNTHFFENMLKFMIQSRTASSMFYKQILKDLEQFKIKDKHIFMQLLDVLNIFEPFPALEMVELVKLTDGSPDVFHKAFSLLSQQVSEKNIEMTVVKCIVDLYLFARNKGLIGEQENIVLLNVLALYPSKKPDTLSPLINKIIPHCQFQSLAGIYQIKLQSLTPGQLYFSLKYFLLEFLHGFHDKHTFHLLVSTQQQKKMIEKIFNDLNYLLVDMQTLDDRVILVSKKSYVFRESLFGSAFKPYKPKENVSRETIQFGHI